jgi:hypothetical protein
MRAQMLSGTPKGRYYSENNGIERRGEIMK